MSPTQTAPNTSSFQPFQSSHREQLSCSVEEFDRERFPPRDTWLKLFEHASESHVSHHPDYVQAVFPDLGLPGWTITCRRGREPVSMAILIPKRCRLGRPLGRGAHSTIVGVRLGGFGFLSADASDVNATNALVETIAREVRARHIRVVEFENLPEDSLLWRSLQKLKSQGFSFAPGDAFAAHHRIRFPSTPEEYWSRFHSRQRYRLRKERKRIGAYEVRRCTELHQIDDWLTAAHEISQKTWQTRQLGLRIRNSDEERAYLTFLATLGALRSYVLYVEGRPAAFVQSQQWNGVYHYDELGFDRNLAKQNPGKVLLQEILDDLLTHNRPQTFDFGLGDADYKRFFANDESRSATLWMFPPGLQGWWQAMSINTSRRIGRWARDAIGGTRWYAALRQSRRDAAATAGDDEAADGE
ncbi:MAG: GNAT family N-acetyltransferase [Planctomycetaceae bacterium]|nr:GNAT family N-acetyltransferase [Planctomycetaceae bacterium]